MVWNLKRAVVSVLVRAGTLASGNGQRTGTTTERSPSRRTGAVTVPPVLAAAAKPFRTIGCDDSLWDHVYHSEHPLPISVDRFRQRDRTADFSPITPSSTCLFSARSFSIQLSKLGLITGG